MCSDDRNAYGTGKMLGTITFLALALCFAAVIVGFAWLTAQPRTAGLRESARSVRKTQEFHPERTGPTPTG
jgi:hypothetical protein